MQAVLDWIGIPNTATQEVHTTTVQAIHDASVSSDRLLTAVETNKDFDKDMHILTRHW